MGQSMHLSLELIEGKRPLEEQAKPYHVTVAGKELSIIFASQKYLMVCNGSSLGYYDGEHCYVTKKLDPPIAPFTALLVYYQSQSTADLSKELGADIINGLSEHEIRKCYHLTDKRSMFLS
ncbi:hypothetical protein HZB02_01060 [Candidatus Woesearchaeota archaeon]|nr:hypothetical protein [Candidatus Woesearchaeota archaeon]